MKIYKDGWLKTDGKHKIYYMQLGNPNGIPVLSFHAGPGDCSWAGFYDFLDETKYNIITFDQRGCGKSEPFGEIADNTTDKILTDAKELLDFIGIREKCILFGGSWGSALALSFGARYPDTTKSLVLSNVLLGRHHDLKKLMCDLKIFKPLSNYNVDENNIFLKIKHAIQTNDIEFISKYNDYEIYKYTFHKNNGLKTNLAGKDFLQKRLYCHFLCNNLFLPDNGIVDELTALSGKPIYLVHNKYDPICNIEQAHLLKKLLPQTELVVLNKRGHGGDFQIDTIKKFFKKA
ncbi:MAG: alpha/beta fold hydrolase [Alphaproteobacteria bacterium]|nr:alpha/beta fold hydrolase [Alphaproteobacteria bacterium]